MTTPTISVALCTHNGERFVAEQIRSILAQTTPVTEIVLGDDASTDATVSVVEKAVAGLGAKAPTLVVIRNEVALGVAANFEATLRACTGELVLLSDQDDSWHPTRVSLTVAEFAARPRLTLLHSDATLVDADGTPTGRGLFEVLGVTADDLASEHEGNGFAVLLTRNIVTGATVALRRSLLDVALPVPPAWIHDEWLAAVSAATGGLDSLERQLVDYRQHGGNVIGVSRLSVAQKWGKLVEPRGDRNTQLAQRALELADRLGNMQGVPADILHSARGKLLHETRRASLSPHRLGRLRTVAAELASGRYSVYGRGTADIARDLVQPA
ncbi:glycosyltransferase involved in cell wall biosynthesis [Conyzicola lurida]|uniref:Glycosyltransferase involved in cell wall biosynthesis n=1 Tax=Conyzicola lurida TaxID=1172621 RepID=A0A841APK1_9MICO|nr:glycosyltransferase family 2 protein [Conyzicola lurida]MBB5844224.1 glycosyltransferase involved in cell wall biosynthesis [Conyzicola lurida]